MGELFVLQQLGITSLVLRREHKLPLSQYAARFEEAWAVVRRAMPEVPDDGVK